MSDLHDTEHVEEDDDDSFDCEGTPQPKPKCQCQPEDEKIRPTLQGKGGRGNCITPQQRVGSYIGQQICVSEDKIHIHCAVCKKDFEK